MDILNFLLKNGLKQSDLANYLGVSEAAVSYMVNGKSNPSQSNLTRILDNPNGWDVSMLSTSPQIINNADHHGNASVEIKQVSPDYSTRKTSSGSSLLLLKQENEMLKSLLEEEKRRSSQYWEMIQTLTKK